jgi:hypothetical protein
MSANSNVSEGMDSEPNAGIESLLRDFFRAEMPSLSPPVAERKRSSWRLSRGQLALAASLLLLLLGQAFLFWAAPSPPLNERGGDQGVIEARNRNGR